MGSPLRILKPGQGIHVRWGTAIGAGVLALSAAYFIYNKIQLFDFAAQYVAVRTAIPVIVLVALAWLVRHAFVFGHRLDPVGQATASPTPNNSRMTSNCST